MTITPIRSIFYLILYSQLLLANNLNITFEIFHTTKEYKDIALEKLNQLNTKGFNCYLVTEQEQLSIRCNDSNSTKQMQKNINRFNQHHISFTIITKNNSKENKQEKEKNLLGYGYKLFNNKKYYKSLQIFQRLYNKEKNINTAYPYALALMKQHQYEKAINVLEPYKKDQKAKKLLHNLKTSYLFYTLQKSDFHKAQQIMDRYNLQNKKEDILYMYALYLQKKHQYNKALRTLESFIYKSTKIKKTYLDILYNKLIYYGWKNIKQDPKKALQDFKNACKIKKEYTCYDGMMNSYFLMGKYNIAEYLATKLYQHKPNDKTALLAMQSNLKLHRYEKAQFWYEKLHNKNNIQTPDLIKNLTNITYLINKKHYKKAQQLLDALTKRYPDNPYILSKKIELALQQQHYQNAKQIAQDLLKQDPNSSEALYAMAFVSFIDKAYNKCSLLLTKSDLTKTYQKDLYYRCKAYEALDQKNIKTAKTNMTHVKDTGYLASFYIDLAKLFSQQKDKKNALLAFKKAQKFKPNDFNLFTSYLYFLKDTDQEELLEEELQKGYKTFPYHEKELDSFKFSYQKEKLYKLYKTKKYAQCLQYSKTIQPLHVDDDILRMSGWCAYFQHNYSQAQQNFKTLITNKETSSEDLYAYALSSYKNNDMDSAIKILKKLPINKLDNSQKINLANLYANLQYQDEAKKLLDTISSSKQKTNTLYNIQRSYTQLFYQNSFSAGFFWQSQKGTSGENKFIKSAIPIDYHYLLSKQTHFYINMDLLHLYNGSLNPTNFTNYGFGTISQSNTLEDDDGILTKIGIDHKNFHFMVGTTPIGSKISPEITWLISTYLKKNKWLSTFKLEQKELDETMLSFVGEKAQEQNKQAFWGRVLKRGGSVGLHYNGLLNLSLNLTYYPDIYGKNTATNSEKKASLVAIHNPYSDRFDYLQIGAIGIYDSFDHNQNLFTYGNGGYFSPQNFIMFGIFTQFGDHINQKLYYQTKLGIGFEDYRVDDTLKFPLHDTLTNSDEIIKGYNEQGFDYKAAFQLGYKIKKKWDLISAISFEAFNSYSLQEFSLALVYKFGHQKENDYNTFYLNHRVNQTIPRYEIAK